MRRPRAGSPNRVVQSEGCQVLVSTSCPQRGDQDRRNFLGVNRVDPARQVLSRAVFGRYDIRFTFGEVGAGEFDAWLRSIPTIRSILPAQASFGSANCDVLSDRGRRQVDTLQTDAGAARHRVAAPGSSTIVCDQAPFGW